MLLQRRMKRRREEGQKRGMRREGEGRTGREESKKEGEGREGEVG